MKKYRLAWLLLAVFGLFLTVSFLWILVEHSSRVHGLADDRPASRAAAIRKMSRTGNEQLLIARLHDDDADVRLLAVERLGGPGPQGDARARALIPLLQDEHAGVRREAAWSLGLIGPDAWPALREALGDESPRVRAGAALALGDAYQHKEPAPWPSREAPNIVPVLRPLLDDPDPDVRRHVKRALDYLPR
jgi:HEAT repeat protein